LVQQILHRFPEIHRTEVLFVGDSLRDLEAAWAEDCHAVLVRTGKGEETLKKHLDRLEGVEVFEDLRAVVKAITK
jgi:D-glycero-D-manno-heptose 1,7-bisphosphate phosphatase